MQSDTLGTKLQMKTMIKLIFLGGVNQLEESKLTVVW